MKRPFALVMASFLAACSGSGSLSPAVRSAPTSDVRNAQVATAVTARAMWVWDAPTASRLIGFARAHGVTSLFVFVSDPQGAELRRLRSYSSAAKAANIALYALAGAPNWAAHPRLATSWENAAMATGLFAGAHFDVESISPACKAADVSNYLTMLHDLRTNQPSTHLEVDVAFWWDNCAVAGYPGLAKAILADTDEVTIMSYRNVATGPNSMFAISKPWLIDAGANRKVRLGADATYEGGATDQPCGTVSITFYNCTGARMAAVLSKVDAAASKFGSYQGISVEDDAGWMALPAN